MQRGYDTLLRFTSVTRGTQNFLGKFYIFLVLLFSLFYEMEIDSVEEKKITDRERDEEMKKKRGEDKVDQAALRRKATQPLTVDVTATQSMKKEFNEDSER